MDPFFFNQIGISFKKKFRRRKKIEQFICSQDKVIISMVKVANNLKSC